MGTVLVKPASREELVNGLRELADFYEQHREVPVVWHPDFHHCVMAPDDEAGVAEVAAVAEALGMRSMVDTRGAEVKTAFGSVEFRAFYLSRREMSAYYDRISYETVVQTAQRLVAGPGLE